MLRTQSIHSIFLHIVYNIFQKIPDPRVFSKTPRIPLIDHLMSALAVFGLKHPSLLSYDHQRRHPAAVSNLKSLYRVGTPPSDTHLRSSLDQLPPECIRPAFKKVFAKIQRDKQLEEFVFMEDHYLLAIDGTGEFSSSKVCCEHCCKKNSGKAGEIYYHQMLGGCIVHPDKKSVIPLCPEAILNRDGQTKNDCERNAAKRFLTHFRREHPHLKVIVIEDGLSSNAPHIKLLEEHRLKYIIVAKPTDHEFLFNILHNSPEEQYTEVRENGILHQFSFLNNVALNKGHPDLKVNVLEYRQTTRDGKELTMSWITNIKITKENAYQIMRGGRARWKIENETFNTLKNLGYNFEHNYGHGKRYLSTNLCMLMLLAFLVDQAADLACHYIQNARVYAKTGRALWEKMRTLFDYVLMESWENFLYVVAGKAFLNTS